MTTPRVVDRNEINLNGIFFPIMRVVQEIPQNIFPPKRVEGDYTRDSNPRLSSMTWSDFRGGIGLDVMEGNETDRAWYSTLWLRHKRSITLAPLAVATVDGFGGGQVEAVNELAEEIYVFDGANDIFKYNNGTDSWGSALHSLGGGASDSINILLGGTHYLIFPYGGVGYTYSSDGSSWTNVTADNLAYIESWDDRAWLARKSGTPAGYIFAPGDTLTNIAQVPVENFGDLLDLFTARAIDAEIILYAYARKGIYAYDAANDRWILTGMQFPEPNPDTVDSPRVVATWNAALYIPAGLSIYEAFINAGGIIVRPMGPDRDGGLPQDKAGTIRRVLKSFNELIALVDAEDLPDTTINSSIMTWDGRGWQVLYASSNSGFALRHGIVSRAYNKYRLWFADFDRVYYIDLPHSQTNLKNIKDFNFAASGELKTPWFHADQVDVDKLAVRAKVETLDTNSSETVTISYALDYNDDIYNQFDAVTTNGVKIVDFSKWHTYLALNGASGDVTVGDDSSIQNQFDGGAGISARIYVDSDGEANAGRIVDKAVWSFRVSGESGGAVKLRFAYAFSGATGLWTSTNTVLNIGEFYRVGADYDNGDADNNPTLFVYREATRTLVILTVGDGLTEDTAPSGTRTTDVGSDLIMGNVAADSGTLDGRLDDVRLYGAAGEIADEDMDNELIGNEDNLIGYWKFNENTGSTANDSSDLNSNGGTISTATFAENTDKAGISFKAIRFKMALARGGTTKNSPRLVSLTLEHRKKLDYKQGFRAQLDLRKRYKNKSPLELRSALQSILEAKSLVELTYRNDTGDTRNFWVDTFLQQGLEQTGYNETGTAVVDLLES